VESLIGDTSRCFYSLGNQHVERIYVRTGKTKHGEKILFAYLLCIITDKTVIELVFQVHKLVKANFRIKE